MKLSKLDIFFLKYNQVLNEKNEKDFLQWLNKYRKLWFKDFHTVSKNIKRENLLLDVNQKRIASYKIEHNIQLFYPPGGDA